MEIARGCGRGCRFCLAGYVYRPAREQPLDRLLASAEAAVAAGHKKVGLVSAAVSDHTQIDELATELQRGLTVASGDAITPSTIGRNQALLGDLLALRRQAGRTVRPVMRSPSNAWGEVTSCTRCRSM